MVDALLARGHRVVVLDDLSGGVAEHVSSEATLVVGSCTDAALVEELFARHEPDYVFLSPFVPLGEAASVPAEVAA